MQAGFLLLIYFCRICFYFFRGIVFLDFLAAVSFWALRSLLLSIGALDRVPVVLLEIFFVCFSLPLWRPVSCCKFYVRRVSASFFVFIVFLYFFCSRVVWAVPASSRL